MASKCLEGLIHSHTYFLLTIVFCFVGLLKNECRLLKEILTIYDNASGQEINMRKSEIYYSRNTSQEMKGQITYILGVTGCIGTRKYLGLPSMIGRKKKQMFGFL